jgi:hypothetical protein
MKYGHFIWSVGLGEMTMSILWFIVAVLGDRESFFG